MLDFSLIGNGAGRKILWNYLENDSNSHLICDLAIEKVQAYLGDITDSVPDHSSKASITIERVIIFLLVGGLGFNLFKKENATSVKCSKTRCACTITE